MLASLERARDSERRFLADASHELRTPLTALRGNVAYLARHGATPELIDDLEADADRLARLADDLLALSREEAALPPEEEVRLDELARSFAAPDVDLAVEPATVRGEPASLERAVSNLVENARRHGPAGGRVTVARRERRRSRPAQRRGRGPGLDRRPTASRPSSGSGARGPTVPARASASRSSARPPSGTAAA